MTIERCSPGIGYFKPVAQLNARQLVHLYCIIRARVIFGKILLTVFIFLNMKVVLTSFLNLVLVIWINQIQQLLTCYRDPATRISSNNNQFLGIWVKATPTGNSHKCIILNATHNFSAGSTEYFKDAGFCILPTTKHSLFKDGVEGCHWAIKVHSHRPVWLSWRIRCFGLVITPLARRASSKISSVLAIVVVTICLPLGKKKALHTSPHSFIGQIPSNMIVVFAGGVSSWRLPRE